MRQGAEVLPKRPRIGPLHEGGPHSKPAEGYGRKDRGPRARALTCVLSAAGDWLLHFGGLWRVPDTGLQMSARVRLLPCGRSKRPGTSAILSRGVDYGADRQFASLPIRPYL